MMYRSTIAIAVLAASTTSVFAQDLTASGVLAPQIQERNPAPDDRAVGVGTAFTYQGYLEVSGAPADGVYDLRFTLYNSDGAVVAGPICRDNVTISDGQFTVTLDFGSQYTGVALYLEIGVRAGGAVGDCAAGLYTTLSPRQPLTPAPYAMGLRLPYTGQSDVAGGPVVSVTNPSSASSSSGLLGINVAPSAFGFIDHAGVRGESSHIYGAGLLGISDLYVGVVGYSAGDDSTGTFGRADGARGIGVRGWSTDIEGIGVKGENSWSTGWAGYFDGRGYFSNRVGIGTLTPEQQLDVNGYVKTNGYQMTSGAGAGKVLTSDASGFGTWQTVPGTIAYVGSTSGGNSNVPSATNQFLSPTMAVTITAGQKIMVNVDRAFGTITAGGANGLNLYVGYRVSGSGAVPTNIGGGMFNLTASQNERKTFGISGVITGLPAGTYEIGMTGTGNANWNNNEWGYITVMVIN